MPADTPVSIPLNNTTPSSTSLIVGSEEVHERHRITGTGIGAHDQVPTEVAVPALTTSKTTVRF